MGQLDSEPLDFRRVLREQPVELGDEVRLLRRELADVGDRVELAGIEVASHQLGVPLGADPLGGLRHVECIDADPLSEVVLDGAGLAPQRLDGSRVLASLRERLGLVEHADGAPSPGGRLVEKTARPLAESGHVVAESEPGLCPPEPLARLAELLHQCFGGRPELARLLDELRVVLAEVSARSRCPRLGELGRLRCIDTEVGEVAADRLGAGDGLHQVERVGREVEAEPLDGVWELAGDGGSEHGAADLEGHLGPAELGDEARDGAESRTHARASEGVELLRDSVAAGRLGFERAVKRLRRLVAVAPDAGGGLGREPDASERDIECGGEALEGGRVRLGHLVAVHRRAKRLLVLGIEAGQAHRLLRLATHRLRGVEDRAELLSLHRLRVALRQLSDRARKRSKRAR